MIVVAYWFVKQGTHKPLITMQQILPNLRSIYLLSDVSYPTQKYENHLLNSGVNEVKVFDDSQDFINQLIFEPDAVIIEHSVQPFNGLEVLKKIRRQNPDLPVIYLSAQQDMKITVDALKFGAFDYIIKGESDLEHLTDVLSRLKRFLHEINLRNKRSFVGILSSITKLF
ncbi:MAG: response regulator [Bacteroidetes bacterium]|nr:response regulator [Bacteroidota bacterium]